MTKTPKLKLRKPPKPKASAQLRLGRPRTAPRDLPEIVDREKQIAEFLKRKKK